MARGVSVLIPVYNTDPEHLQEAVKSVYAQNFTDAPFEVIVVDDGSTRPETRAAVDALETVGEFHNLRALRSAENSGQGVALNTGLAHAQFDTILPLDSDDILVPSAQIRTGAGYMAQGFRYLEQNPKTHLFVSEWKEFGATSAFSAFQKFSPKNLIAGNMIPNYAMYRKKDVLGAGGYHPNIRSHADWTMWLRLLAHLTNRGVDMRVQQSREALYLYRKHTDGRSLLDQSHAHIVDIVRKVRCTVPELCLKHFGVDPRTEPDRLEGAIKRYREDSLSALQYPVQVDAPLNLTSRFLRLVREPSRIPQMLAYRLGLKSLFRVVARGTGETKHKPARLAKFSPRDPI